MNYTSDLRKFVAPEIITGLNSRLLISRYIQHFGSMKPMIVSDKNLTQKPWFLDIIQEIVPVVHSYIIFDDVTSNPRDYEVMKGAELFIKERCDLIIAIGGGSPIDCAKGICIVSTNGGHIIDYEGVDEINLPGPPLICIPTTSGASADVSQFAIIGDSSTKIKKAIISKKVVPDLALLDATPLTTMDPYLTACTGMDALTHAIEAFVSNASSHLSDVHALEAINLINDNIEAAISPNRSIETLHRMMLGSLQAGLAFSNASLGLVHAMAHSMGGLLDLPHGECNSILLEHVIDLNFDSASKEYREIALKMNLPVQEISDQEVKNLLINRIRMLRTNLGIKEFESVSNLPENIYDSLSENALNDPCIITNPKKVTKEDAKSIFQAVIQKNNS